MIRKLMRAGGACALIAALALPTAGHADDARSYEGELHALRGELRDLRERTRTQARMIEALEARVLEMELAQRGRGVPGGGTLTAQASQQAPAAGSDRKSAAGSEPVREPGRAPVVQQIAQQELAPLFERRLTLEAGLTYQRFDRRQLTLSGFLALDAIFLGQIQLGQVRSDAFVLDLTGRYGLTDRLSMDLNVPFLYRHNTYIEGGVGGAAATLSEATVSTGRIGDVNAGLFYQLYRETASLPDIVASVRLHAPTGRSPFGLKFINPDPTNNNLDVPETLPTGTGVWRTQLGLSVLKTSDPLVLFANLGYTRSFQRGFDDISPTQGVIQPGRVRIGDAWTWGGGFAVAFNERTSVSLSVAQQIGAKTRLQPVGQTWQDVIGSDYNSATFQTGLTHQLGRGLFMIGTLGVGITPDAPDFSIGLKFPYTF